MDDRLADQLSSLLESTASLQRTLAHVISQLPVVPAKQHIPSMSDLNLQTPASAQASILAPGRVMAEARSRLMKDGWPDCDDTDMHAGRLTEAMLRVSSINLENLFFGLLRGKDSQMGMEDMDNFMTEASRLNCSNMAISATLVSAIVATFMSETYSNVETLHMRVVNGLWFLSLLLSLATATLCMLVSEWLTWSTSQELRDLSLLYRLIRTAFRSLFMHLSIFLFFAGLLVLMWNESTVAVCVVPSLALGLFILYYVSATVRSPLYSLLFDIRQFDDKDFRGLRDPIHAWHSPPGQLLVYSGYQSIRKAVRKWNARNSELLEPKPQRPQLRDDLPDSEKTITLALETATTNMNVNASQTLSPISATTRDGSPGPLRQRGSGPQLRHRGPSPLRDCSPLGVRGPLSSGVESPQAVSRVGTPVSMSGVDLVDPEAEHQRKLRATRLRRLTEHEIMRPVKSVGGRSGDV
ncbi:transmembrane protein [Rhizoctonia solani]|uniref:Transmembrane protein n=1 Tax=Rhizoctonia solani TaxID=456999 RepID=A0A8H8NW79_9AGAM|nr:uncharacterized protein RhiXN_06053 [Rhizoctonia solani]QRW21064.1 transmembrane protein [Rhizoctonia solani]